VCECVCVCVCKCVCVCVCVRVCVCVYIHTDRQTTSFNEFLNRGRHSASGKRHLPRHAGHTRAARARSSRCCCFSAYSTPSFLHPHTFLTYCIPYSHSQATHLSALSLIKDCLAVRLTASFRSARFTSSASFVVPVASSDSTALLAYHRPRIEAVWCVVDLGHPCRMSEWC
jgi:hypothetical protein